MIEIADLFFLLLMFVGAWIWWIDRGIKQFAFSQAKKYCERADVQLLDDNIRLSGMSLQRNAAGALKIKRAFKFEFTSTGERRYQGKMEMLGSMVIDIHLEPHLL